MLKSLSPMSTQFSAWRHPTATSLGAFSAAAFVFLLSGFFGSFVSYKFARNDVKQTPLLG